MSLKKDNELMLMTDDHIKKFSKLIDAGFDAEKVFKNAFWAKIAEAGDGPFIKIALTQINKLASPYIPDEYKDEAQTAFDDCLDGDKDYTEVITNGISILDQIASKIEAPEWVLTMISSLINLVKTALLLLLEKKSSESDEE